MFLVLIFLGFFSASHADFCSTERDTLAIYPSPNNCSTFIACVNNEEQELACVQAPQFIPGSESPICMTPCESISVATKAPKSDASSLPPDPILFPDSPARTIVCPPTSETRAVVPQSCGEFISCKDGIGTKEKCPEGQEFSPTKYECVSKKIAGCSKKKPKGKFSQKCRFDKGEEPIYFASSVCPEFKKCAVQLAWDVKCAQHCNWNNEEKTCEWADQFDCNLTNQ